MFIRPICPIISSLWKICSVTSTSVIADQASLTLEQGRAKVCDRLIFVVAQILELSTPKGPLKVKIIQEYSVQIANLVVIVSILFHLAICFGGYWYCTIL
ncbi:hypothetical protein RND81_03G026500 [Saponaria officinalis]|uniref:Uncharacterized protein n=1 Tax=Saponaria officinalis TaxID=3572 RepID=A0AAW1M4X9_SAPOF